MTKHLNLEAMSIDEMWLLHEKVVQVLSARLASEKRELEKKLAKLGREKEIPLLKPLDERVVKPPFRGRRKYPPVFPKFRNPDEPSETWSGRGKRPRWMTAVLQTGRTLEELRIADVAPAQDRLRGQRSK